MVGSTDALIELADSLSKTGVSVDGVNSGVVDYNDADKDKRIKELEDEIEDYKEEFNRLADICDKIVDKYEKVTTRLNNLEEQDRKIKKKQKKIHKRIGEVQKYVEVVEDIANATAAKVMSDTIMRERQENNKNGLFESFKHRYSNDVSCDSTKENKISLKDVNTDENGKVLSAEFEDGNGHTICVG